MEDINENVFTVDKIISEYRISFKGFGVFRVKVYKEGKFYVGHTNVLIPNKDGIYSGVLGDGKTESQALSETLNNFIQEISWKKNWSLDDLQWSDPDDF